MEKRYIRYVVQIWYIYGAVWWVGRIFLLSIYDCRFNGRSHFVFKKRKYRLCNYSRWFSTSFNFQYQIDDAIIVYNRLDAETVSKSLTDANIEEILRVLNNLPSSTSEPFLNTFIPVTMMHKPAALSLFVKWLHNRIFQLEKRDSSNFPDNGITLAEAILKLMRVDSNSTISFQRYRALNKEGIDELAELMEGLHTLRQLKTEYNVIISLAEYLQVRIHIL